MYENNDNIIRSTISSNITEGNRGQPKCRMSSIYVVSHACFNVLIKYLLMFVGFNFFFSRARFEQFATVFPFITTTRSMQILRERCFYTPPRIGGSRSKTRTHHIRSINIIWMAHICAATYFSKKIWCANRVRKISKCVHWNQASRLCTRFLSTNTRPIDCKCRSWRARSLVYVQYFPVQSQSCVLNARAATSKRRTREKSARIIVLATARPPTTSSLTSPSSRMPFSE